MMDPNLAFLLLVAGALAISFEAHAPGTFLAGLLGVVLVGFGAFELYQNDPTWYGVALLCFAIVLFVAELRFHSHGISGVAGAGVLFAGAIALVRGPHRIDPWLAAAVAIACCLIAVFLGILGLRMRNAKPLNGTETLIGEIGVARTAISGEGMVFVRGEYWRAHSAHPIPAGTLVVIKRVENLLVEVNET